MCTARSALSAVIILPNGKKFGDHPHVKQFIKGFFNTDPPKPRYTATWDPNVITKMLKSWYPATKLNMLRLAKKIVMLILLITGQRGQILTALNVEQMCIRPDYFIFKVRNSDIKQGRQNYKPEPIRLKAYPDKRLCIVHYLKIYLERTLHVRQAEKQLLLTTTRPFRAASRDTVSRWVRAVMEEAGIDVSVFKPGSTRAAATSKAHQSGVTLDKILRAGAWASESTFSTWYKREVIPRKDNHFAACVLDQSWINYICNPFFSSLYKGSIYIGRDANTMKWCRIVGWCWGGISCNIFFPWLCSWLQKSRGICGGGGTGSERRL